MTVATIGVGSPSNPPARLPMAQPASTASKRPTSETVKIVRRMGLPFRGASAAHLRSARASSVYARPRYLHQTAGVSAYPCERSDLERGVLDHGTTRDGTSRSIDAPRNHAQVSTDRRTASTRSVSPIARGDWRISDKLPTPIPPIVPRDCPISWLLTESNPSSTSLRAHGVSRRSDVFEI